MVTFDINGAIVEFDEKTDNYNSIRKSFKNQAEYALSLIHISEPTRRS